MDIIRTSIPGVYNILPKYVEDNRGKTIKYYDKEIFAENDVHFVPGESLIIESKKNVLRGMHFQCDENQAKIVRCISGKVWTAVADIRSTSCTFGQWVYVDLNNGGEVFVPGGCAVGTLAQEDSYLLCMFGEEYDSKKSNGIIWNDEKLNIKWPLDILCDNLIISKKDSSLSSLDDFIAHSLR